MWQERLQSCESCRELISEEGKYERSPSDPPPPSCQAPPEPELAAALTQVREFELELAQTKLQLGNTTCSVRTRQNRHFNCMVELPHIDNNPCHVLSCICFWQERLQSCESCKKLISEEGKYERSPSDPPPPCQAPAEPELAAALTQVREFELELAQTKLQLVESQCQAQDLEHQVRSWPFLGTQ